MTTRRSLSLLLGLGALLALSACGEGPKQAYYGMATAAEMGDRQGFLDGFTKESRPLIEAQISLSEGYGLKRDNPVRQLVFKAVDKVETSDGQAILSVSRGSRKARILMVETDDGWKIDTKKLAEFWEQEKKTR